MFCQNCGKEITNGEGAFCIYCGAKLFAMSTDMVHQKEGVDNISGSIVDRNPCDNSNDIFEEKNYIIKSAITFLNLRRKYEVSLNNKTKSVNSAMYPWKIGKKSSESVDIANISDYNRKLLQCGCIDGDRAFSFIGFCWGNDVYRRHI